MGGPRAGPAAILRAVSDYREAAPVAVGDHVIIGTNPNLGVVANACWPSARLVVRGGPDGADIALLGEVKDDCWVAARYDRIVVGSGDSVFRGCGQDVQAATAWLWEWSPVSRACHMRSVGPPRL